MSKAYELDLKYSDADKAKAAELRQAGFARFDDNQINWSARRLLDQVESNSGSHASSNFTRVSVAQAGRDAMNDLKSTLQGLRSKQISQFNESVPPSSTESRFRGTVAVDSASTNLNTYGKKTAITLNVCPHSKDSFLIARDDFIVKYQVPKETSNGVPHALFAGRLKCKPGVSQQEADALCELVRKALPGLDSEEEANGFKMTTETVNGQLYLVFLMVNREEETDPFEKILAKMAANFTDCSKYDEPAIEASANSPGFFRLATLRAELGTSLGDWVNTNEASWIKLAESTRVGFEVIFRHDLHRILHEHLAKALLDSFGYDLIRESLSAPTLFMTARDTSVNVKMAPLELLYALGVRDGGFTQRRVKEATGFSRKFSSAHGDDAAKAYAEHFASTGPEDLTSFMFSDALFLGLTSTKIQQRILCEMSRPAIDGLEEEQVATIAQIFPTLAKLVAEVESGVLIAHSFTIGVKLEGVDESVWKFFPHSPTEIVNAAKPIALAGNGDFDPAAPDAFTDDADEDSFRVRKYWPRGAFEEKAEEIVNKKLAPGEYIDADKLTLIIPNPKLRNAALRIAVCVNSEDSTQSWARVLKAFGAEVFGAKEEGESKKKRGDDDEDSDADGSDDDDGDEDGPGLPDPTEGYYRAAYIKRPDGQFIELIRPVSTTTESVALLRFCDAVVVVDEISEIEILGESASSKLSAEEWAEVKVPVLFVSAKSDTANAETNGTITTFTPKTTDYKVLPQGSNVESAGDAMLSWLISNSEHPERGTNRAEPASAWDFGYDMKLTVP